MSPAHVAAARTSATTPAVPSTAPRLVKKTRPTASQKSNHGANSIVSQAVKKLPTRNTRSRRGKKAFSIATKPTIATIRNARVTREVLPAEIVRQNWNLF